METKGIITFLLVNYLNKLEGCVIRDLGILSFAKYYMNGTYLILILLLIFDLYTSITYGVSEWHCGFIAMKKLSIMRPKLIDLVL